MALDKNFPKSPYEILDPSIRWYPGDEAMRENAHRLIPPLVTALRIKVKEWRDKRYEGASETSKSLLNFWFNTEHLIPQEDGTTIQFEYYFAQREALETIIYLYDAVGAKDKYDLMRFDSTGAIQTGMFDEDWTRYVIKMATGSGKTKVLALVLVWSFFHKLYEEDSALAQNFLVIAPNIIVLERILADFNGFKVFFQDPMLPENGYAGNNWKDDFQLKLHVQDQVNVTNKIGNVFLTNIHRVFESKNSKSTIEDENTTNYFLGQKPVGKTNESKIDLGEIVRSVDELVVLNDEAHHIHDETLAWFKSIQDIHNILLQKGKNLSLQIDVTATPRKKSGAIFVQTISDYPLVEAIHQNVVKHPVLPDEASRAKISEKTSAKYTERYSEYLELGYIEWKKVFEEQKKNHKKAVLFVMTDDTTNCDDVASYLEATYPDLKDCVLTIHTNRSGDISESGGKNEDELKLLRKEANDIDKEDSKYRAIVSVLMLKEGWDVKNVTTIVGLRAFSSKSNILPEQTLGRGLRRMYRGSDIPEEVSVVGTQAFMDFVESIRNEGVELEYKKMGRDTAPKTPPVVAIDDEDKNKDIEKLDIEIPILTPRIYREYKNFSDLNLDKFEFKKVNLKKFSEEQQKEILFKGVVDEKIGHITILDTLISDPSNAIGFFAQVIKHNLHLVGGYDILYEKVKDFVQNYLFDKKVDLNDRNVLRNLSETEARKTIIETFEKEINELTIMDRGETEIKDYIKVSNTRPFVVKPQELIIPKKSVFNKIIGDSHFELEIAAFLEKCPDIISYTKNYLALGFKLDYKNSNGEISNYFPDFIVKIDNKNIYIVETKGREDLDDELKYKRLQQWCEDVGKNQKKIIFTSLFISQEDYLNYRPQTFKELIKISSKTN